MAQLYQTSPFLRNRYVKSVHHFRFGLSAWKFFFGGGDGLEIQPQQEPEGSPSWRVQVEYTNHTEQDICSYEDCLPDRPEEMYNM